MKRTSLTLLSLLLLMLSAPLLAQTGEPSQEPQAEDAPLATADAPVEDAAVTDQEQVEPQPAESDEAYAAESEGEYSGELAEEPTGAEGTPEDEPLPKTASLLPLLALLGLAAVGSAFVLRRFQRG